MKAQQNQLRVVRPVPIAATGEGSQSEFFALAMVAEASLKAKRPVRARTGQDASLQSMDAWALRLHSCTEPYPPSRNANLRSKCQFFKQPS